MIRQEDNELTYKFVAPDDVIADFVHGFSMIRNMQTISNVVLIPNARVDLFFVQETDGRLRVALVGLETKPGILSQNNHQTMFVISFNPLAAEYIFGHTIADILDSQKALPDDYWDFDIADLDDFNGFCKKMSLKIHSLLPAKMDERKRRLFEAIFTSDGEIAVKELSKKVFWSARQMNQYFNQQYGLSVKMYCNILRFQASLPHIKQGKLFPQLNYYDQSHFIKEIRRLSGASPKELLRNKNSRFLQFLAIGAK